MQFPQFYQTNDTVLATALILCGVPCATHADGRPFPQLMIYDPDILRRHGYPKGMDFVQAASQAMNDSKAGVRVYQFQRTPQLEEIIVAYRNAEKTHKTGKNIDLANVEPGDVAAILMMGNQIRRMMLSDFKGPAIAVSSEKVHVERDAKDSSSKITGKFSAQSVPAKR